MSVRSHPYRESNGTEHKLFQYPISRLVYQEAVSVDIPMNLILASSTLVLEGVLYNTLKARATVSMIGRLILKITVP